MNRLLLLSLALAAGLSLSAAPRADRNARVDAGGVLRWTDDGSEVALVGVNYYPPFTCDYAKLARLGADHREVMRQDVAHFRRLGLGVVRIHCFDREFSTADGGFVDNHHVELLDYLIDLCAENGIYMVLTPIAWWGGAHYAPGNIDGFSNHFDMREMTSDRRAWKVQARFLGEFAGHVNRYTGKRYADDPAVLAFECINEPLYPANHPDGEVTAYIDALVDGLRASGTTKPVYYNSWQNRNAAAGASRCDGVTGSYYPTGLVAGHALEGSQLGRILASSLKPDASVARKSRMIYEFDAADTPGSYMYPAMGRLFRHEGVQVAAMFQYDPLRIANVNAGWRTHHLNLVYTPAKAISIAIMAETFRHLPRGCDYAPHGVEIQFPPFRVNAERDLSEFVLGDRYYYTSDPVTPPARTDGLRHVWGCGQSAVAGSTGNGAYFLDRVADGVWRLQLYPSVFTVNDPYSGRSIPKEVVLAESPVLHVNLPDLGHAWTATPLAGGDAVRAVDQRAPLAPGDYVLTAGAPAPAQLAAARAADLPPFVAPAAERPTPRLSASVPAQWNAADPLPYACRCFAVTNILAEFVRKEDGAIRRFPARSGRNEFPGGGLSEGTWGLTFRAQGPNGAVTYPNAETDGGFCVRIRERPGDWEFFDVRAALRRGFLGHGPGFWQGAARDDRGEPAYHLHANSFTGRADSVSFRLEAEGATYARLFPGAGAARTLVLRARSRAARTDRLEVALVLANGQVWGRVVDLKTTWEEIRIPLATLRYFSHWGGMPEIGATDRPDIRLVQSVNFCFGRWLFPKTADQAHDIEISSLRIEE